MHVCTYIYVYMYLYMYVCMYVCIYIYIYIDTYIHTYTRDLVLPASGSVCRYIHTIYPTATVCARCVRAKRL